MKKCPKCKSAHTKPGTYCSRVCANSRVWSVEDRLKKSNSAKTSPLVKRAKKFLKLGTHSPSRKQKEIDRFLSGLTVDRQTIKKRLIEVNGEICSACGITNEWNGIFLSLQVDHRNGINNDNRPENLRLLCPNCHSQTSNFSGKSSRKKLVP